VCELLLDALADVHRPIGGKTALILARQNGNVEVEEVIERHVASLMLQDQGADDAAQYRRAHVLPRVSPVLSEAILQALPPVPTQAQSAPNSPEGGAVPYTGIPETGEPLQDGHDAQVLPL